MKVIFLDIDGVLNPEFYMNALFEMWESSNRAIKLHDDFGQLFFEQNCRALEKIIDKTGAKIVLSSSWKYNGIDFIRRMWQKRKIAGEVIDLTPSAERILKQGFAKTPKEITRGFEIKSWMTLNNFSDNYCIIDDDNDMLPEQYSKFVKTNGNVGLTDIDADLAIEILNNTNNNHEHK